mmetsp:Transcript_30148/g.62746  ORF Transcript_30148/g.62746 Transcript_30148/m.62746 type:complete len:333 (+) Transcript_30148:50-1048(+)
MVFSFSQRKALSIIPHITGALSVIGSLSILYDILKDRSRKLHRPYYRILLGMSFFDVFASASLGMSTWPIPRGTEGVYGAIGTTQTCTAQGFFIQLMLVSPFYNLMLAWYYLLLGKNKPLSEEAIASKYEKYMHSLAIIPTISIAVAGLPLTLYNNANLWCWIAAYPPTCDNDEGTHGHDWPCERGENAWLFRWTFFYAPLWFIITAITVMMIILTRAVRREEKQVIEMQKQTRLRRPSFKREEEIRRGQHLQNYIPQRELPVQLERSKQMFYQAVFYVGAFYITYVFATLNRLTQLIGGDNIFVFMIMTSTLTPMQGFLNFLVYRHGPCVA